MLDDPLPEMLAILADLGACPVSDALDRLGVAAAVPGIRCQSGRFRPVVGEAVTVGVAPRRDATPAPHLGTEAIAGAGPTHVLVMANGGRTDVSAWGGLMSLASHLRGVRAAIVDGACRDVTEAAQLGFPVYARGVVTITARGRVVQSSVNQPVTVGSVRVHAGDIVVADDDGVVFIPRARLDETVREAQRIGAREAEMAESIRSGQSIYNVMHDDRFASPRGHS